MGLGCFLPLVPRPQLAKVSGLFEPVSGETLYIVHASPMVLVVGEDVLTMGEGAH